MCKSVEYYATKDQVVTTLDTSKAVLSSLLPPALVQKVGADFLEAIGGADIARLKALLSNGKDGAVASWVLSKPGASPLLMTDPSVLVEMRAADRKAHV